MDEFSYMTNNFNQMVAELETTTVLKEQLELSEARFRQLFELSPDGIMIVGADATIHAANPAMQRLLKAEDAKDLIGKSMFAFIAPEQQDYCAACFGGITSHAPSIVQVETVFINFDGEAVPVEVNAGQFASSDQPAMQVIVRDIFFRQQGEQALRDSTTKLMALAEEQRLLLNDTRDFIYRRDTRGNFIYLSPAVERLTGFSAEEWRTNYASHLTEKLINEEMIANAEEVILTGRETSPYLVEITHKDGRRMLLEINERPFFENRKVAGIIGVARDITERKQTEAEQVRLQNAVEQAAQAWRLTFDAIESPIVILDLEGKITRLNRVAREVSGRSFEEILGQSVEEIGVGQPWQAMAEFVKLCQKSRVAMSGQTRDVATDRTWDIVANPYTRIGDEAEGVVLVARDITGMVKLQETLRRSERMSEMGALVAGVAHEVRNPLFSISATLDACEALFGEQTEQAEFMKMMRVAVDRLTQLMTELLDYGKPMLLTLAEGSIQEVLMQAINSCAPQSERARVAVCNRTAASDFPPVMMDHGRLMQVFQNLIENAIQHSPSRSTVTVEAIEVREKDGMFIDCRVMDSGSGFRNEDLPKIFEPFFTRRRGGTGLGLSIVQRIVEEHQGVIKASNRPQGGACMTVRLAVLASQSFVEA